MASSEISAVTSIVPDPSAFAATFTSSGSSDATASYVSLSRTSVPGWLNKSSRSSGGTSSCSSAAAEDCGPPQRLIWIAAAASVSSKPFFRRPSASSLAACPNVLLITNAYARLSCGVLRRLASGWRITRPRSCIVSVPLAMLATEQRMYAEGQSHPSLSA